MADSTQTADEYAAGLFNNKKGGVQTADQFARSLFGKIIIPDNVIRAQKKIGSHADNGYCQRFVERETTGKSGSYGSAIQAWNAQQNRAQTDLSQINPGDLVYFSADKSNKGYGHAGIYEGDGKFISATDKGVQSVNLDEWQKRTGQKVLGFIPKE